MAARNIGRCSDVVRVEHRRLNLLRTLVDQAEQHDDVQHGRPDAEQVILEGQVDGNRYILIRLPRVRNTQALLSPREQEIVRMVAQGHSNKIIAGVLNISNWTVCTHLRRIFSKLGVTSRAAMVARLLDNEKHSYTWPSIRTLGAEGAEEKLESRTQSHDPNVQEMLRAKEKNLKAHKKPSSKREKLA